MKQTTQNDKLELGVSVSPDFLVQSVLHLLTDQFFVTETIKASKGSPEELQRFTHLGVKANKSEQIVEIHEKGTRTPQIQG